MASKKGASAISVSERNWEAESDCDTLMRAEKIQADPKRMKAVRLVAKMRLEEAAAVVSQTSPKE